MVLLILRKNLKTKLSKPDITYLQKLKKMREGSLGGCGTLGMCHSVDVPVDACAILEKRLENSNLERMIFLQF